MLVDEIGTRLSTQGIASSSGESGWYLFLGMMPDSTAIADKAVSITETPGGPPYARIELDEPHFQLRVRGASLFDASSAYVEARAKMEDAKLALHGLTPGTYSGWYYAGLWAMQEPFLLEYDANNRPNLACNFRALRSRTT